MYKTCNVRCPEGHRGVWFERLLFADGIPVATFDLGDDNRIATLVIVGTVVGCHACDPVGVAKTLHGFDESLGGQVRTGGLQSHNKAFGR